MLEIGQIFGKWAVIDNKEVDKKVLCRCKCGKERFVFVKNLLSGKSSNCGCWKYGNKNGHKENKYLFIDGYVVGEVYGGYKFYVDLEDYSLIKNYCWHKHKNGYFRTKKDGKMVLMHKLILELYCKNYDEIDHINGNCFDNRRCNLRVVKHKDNMKNSKICSRNKSGIKGVRFDEKSKKWICEIQSEKNRLRFCYDKKEDAISKRKYLEDMYFNEYNRKEKDLNNGTE